MSVKIFYLTVSAPIAAMLVHNLVEVTWTDYPVLKGFWMLVAVLAVSMRLPPGALALRPEHERLALLAEEEEEEEEEEEDGRGG